MWKKRYLPLNKVQRICELEGLFYVLFSIFFPNCIPGFYGPKCEYHCNKFCKWDYCNKATGTCLYGCDIGYLGSHCNFSKKHNYSLYLNSFSREIKLNVFFKSFCSLPERYFWTKLS